jgi:hypothetical protein
MIRWVVGLAVLSSVGIVTTPAHAIVDSANANPAIAQANKPPRQRGLDFDAVTVAAWEVLLKPAVALPLKPAAVRRIPGFQLKRTKAPPDLSIPY